MLKNFPRNHRTRRKYTKPFNLALSQPKSSVTFNLQNIINLIMTFPECRYQVFEQNIEYKFSPNKNEYLKKRIDYEVDVISSYLLTIC